MPLWSLYAQTSAWNPRKQHTYDQVKVRPRLKRSDKCHSGVCIQRHQHGTLGNNTWMIKVRPRLKSSINATVPHCKYEKWGNLLNKN